MTGTRLLCFAILGVLLAPLAARADSGAVYTGDGWDSWIDSENVWHGSGVALQAEVRFEVVNGNQLKVTLTNTSLKDTPDNSAVLTAVFFQLRDYPLLPLTPSGATAKAGQWLVSSTKDGGTVTPSEVKLLVDLDVGGEWAYKNLADPYVGTNAIGVSSSGLGLFGSGDLFGGPDLDPPASPDGVNFGILSAGDLLSTVPQASTGFIRNSVEFTLSGLPSGFVATADDVENLILGSITNVTFQYGTAVGEPYIVIPGIAVTPPPVPEPLTLLSLTLAIGGLGAYVRRRTRLAA